MAQKKSQSNPKDAPTMIALGVGGWLLYQLFLNPQVVQTAGKVVQSCCGK